MSRLIDADALERELVKYNSTPGGYLTRIEVKRIENLICEWPTVDAVPMVHGRWELVDEAEPRRYGCSECSCLSWYGTYKYCPNCGARMDGETDDHG